MRGVVNTGMPPPWPSLHDCRIHQFPLSPPWYECYSQTTFSYQSYFKIRQFWNAIPCSELLRFLLKLQCHSIHSLLLLPNPASFLPLLQALVPRVFLHTNGHLRVCLLGTHLPRAGRNQGQGWEDHVWACPILVVEKAMAPQYPCLENPIDGGAWWAAIHGVAKSQTRLKWLSSIPVVLSWTSLSTYSWGWY